MAKLDLTSQDWCQMIFAGKNQAYGAFRMRKYSGRRHTIAMLWVLAIAIVGFSIPTLIKMATPEQKEVITEVATLSTLEQPEVKQKEVQKVVAQPVAPPALKSSVKFTTPKIVEDDKVDEDNEIKSQDELNATDVAISIADVKGNDEEDGALIEDLGQIVVQGEPVEEEVLQIAEQMPSFPGGMGECMKWLAENVHYPPIAAETGQEGKVILQFTVNTDGSIVDIQVVRSVSPALDQEAIRAVKAMPKWIPGRQNGKEVRVKFTLPVNFKLS